MAELTDAEKKQLEINRKIHNRLSKKDLPLKVKFRVKGQDNQIFYSLIPYSFYKEANDKGVSLKDLNPKKRQLKYGDIFEVIDVSPFDSALFITKDGFGISKTTLTSFDFIEEKPSLNTKESNSTNTSNIKLEQDLNNSPLGKTARKVQIGFSVVGWGIFGLLAYKFWNKSTTWKLMLSIFGAYNLYSTYKVFSKPAIKVGNSNIIEDGGNQVQITPTNNLTKSQKIDLIIKNQNIGEQMDADEVNSSKSFLNTLNDSDLNIWISLSKALKDDEIKKAGESGDTSKMYKIFQSKYGLKQNQVDEQMKKMSDFLTKAFESAGLKVTESKNNFSNFESDINLDLDI